MTPPRRAIIDKAASRRQEIFGTVLSAGLVVVVDRVALNRVDRQRGRRGLRAGHDGAVDGVARLAFQVARAVGRIRPLTHLTLSSSSSELSTCAWASTGTTSKFISRPSTLVTSTMRRSWTPPASTSQYATAPTLPSNPDSHDTGRPARPQRRSRAARPPSRVDPSIAPASSRN